ncbi:hypothetical protein FA95DRAFT_1569832 [Auriscalpium vulgare]|uniref:Uncharacterized protein n=1 Tax=Auriscalpium vulgare TaxID=40419 RepID=A0ACB8S6J6_9AGAM|nr:hypothetical protein FA95DRAFT_1569832 [Auriscalpium vulgare]
MIALTYFMIMFTVLTVSVSSAPTRSVTPKGTQTGKGTFFSPGLGACGRRNTDADSIVAVSKQLFDNFPRAMFQSSKRLLHSGAGANPNANPICGKKITANSGGKSVKVTVVDRCVGCSSTIWTSRRAFNKLANPAKGVTPITWTFD